MEKDRLKRDLDSNGLSLRELKETMDKLDSDCKVNIIIIRMTTSISSEALLPFVASPTDRRTKYL